MQIDREQRIRRAEELFMQGFNCSQSVVAAFADIYGYTEEQALRMSAGFGAGIGRMRMSCGAFNALALLAGLDCGSVTPGDREGKSYNYKVVQELAARFKEEHGTLICAELLKLKKGAPLSYEASERTAEYYKKRPCVNQIISAARIYCDYLENISLHRHAN
jgi:C_GCAxxG_C_C family probable redox protein